MQLVQETQLYQEVQLIAGGCFHSAHGSGESYSLLQENRDDPDDWQVLRVTEEAGTCLRDYHLTGRGTSPRNGTWIPLLLPSDVFARWEK
jgi:hypothetical protein